MALPVLVISGLATFAASAAFGRSGWTWTVSAAVGVVLGLFVDRVAETSTQPGRDMGATTARLATLAAAGVAAYDLVAAAAGLPRDGGRFWWIATITTAVVTGVGVAMGRAIRFRDARRWPVGRRATAIVVLVSMAVIGYVGYVGYRSVDFTEAAVASADCRTPSDVYGWAFEPINYDPVEDARVRDSNPDRTRCSADRRGAAPGDAVVTADGVRLAGWYIPAARGMGVTGPTLLVVHGWKSDKTGALDYAWPFHEDYNLVLFDLRNNGQSSGHQTSMGLYEQRDVERILDWLETTKRPAWVGGVGNSMGAATLLAVAEHDARLRALILDSMHADSVTSAENALENDFGIPGGPAAWALVQGVSLRVGSDVTSIDPISRVAGLGSRPVLFLQGTADQVDPPDEAADRNLRAALAAGVPAEVGYCPGARHGLVVRTCPELWAGRSLEFLQRAQRRDVP